MLETLTQDHGQALSQLHGEKQRLLDEKRELSDRSRTLRDERQKAQSDLDDAYEALAQSKASINAWHAKSKRSPWLLGNGGRPLPKHSLFGQSFGDLNGLKSDRDEAVEDIQRCKRARSRVIADQEVCQSRWRDNKEALDTVFAGISHTKQRRQQCHDLLRQGVRARQVEEDLRQLLAQESAWKHEINQRRIALDDLVKVQTHRLGLAERMEALSRLGLQHEAFMRGFDAPEARAERRRLHRERWLASHG